MEDTSILQALPSPHRSSRQLHLQNVGGQPSYIGDLWPEALLRDLQRRAGKVQYRNVLVAIGKEVIDQRGLATAHVDDRRLLGDCSSANLVKRLQQMGCIPAHGFRRLGSVDGFPVGLSAHEGR